MSNSQETMRAVDIRNGAGAATDLFINDATPKPEAKGSQAIVRVKAFGLNRMDLSQRTGGYPVPPQAPKTLGVEFSGVIESFGPEARQGESYKVGDEVFGLAYGGAYAEYIAVSTHMLIPKPAELSFEQCAAIPETWITALQALELIGGFEPGKSVLWHAGASSVSIAGIQLSLSQGASAVYATARQDDKCKFCVETLGCKAAFNTTSESWSKELLDATGGKGVDIIIDYIGAPVFQGNLDVVARDGRIVNLAALGGVKLPAGVDISQILRKRVRIEGSSLRSRDEAYQGKLRNLLVDLALSKFRDGSFKIIIEKVLDWENIIEAHQLMESNQTKGKIICTIK